MRRDPEVLRALLPKLTHDRATAHRALAKSLLHQFAWSRIGANAEPAAGSAPGKVPSS